MTEQVPQKELTQEEKDALWLKQVPEALRTVAADHGKMVFILAFNFGGVNEALQRIATMVNRYPNMREALAYVEKSMDIIASIAMDGAKINIKQIHDCQKDIVIAARLHQPVQGNRIIVPN